MTDTMHISDRPGTPSRLSRREATRQRAAILRALTDDRLGLRIAQVHRAYSLLVTALDLARDDPWVIGHPLRPSRGDGARAKRFRGGLLAAVAGVVSPL
jgi:hypothetical protein